MPCFRRALVKHKGPSRLLIFYVWILLLFLLHPLLISMKISKWWAPVVYRPVVYNHTERETINLSHSKHLETGDWTEDLNKLLRCLFGIRRTHKAHWKVREGFNTEVIHRLFRSDPADVSLVGRIKGHWMGFLWRNCNSKFSSRVESINRPFTISDPNICHSSRIMAFQMKISSILLK